MFIVCLQLEVAPSLANASIAVCANRKCMHTEALFIEGEAHLAYRDGAAFLVTIKSIKAKVMKP